MKRLNVLMVLFAIVATAFGQNYSVELVRKAESGDAKAQAQLGVCYERGDGVAKDYSRAVYWYQKAAAQGQAVAINNLG